MFRRKRCLWWGRGPGSATGNRAVGRAAAAWRGRFRSRREALASRQEARMATVRGQVQARPQGNEPEVLRPVARPSLRELLQEIRVEGTHLVRKEIELVRIELREDVRTEAIAVGCLSAACAGGVIGAILLLVTLILALAHVMPGWGAALIVSGAVLLISAVIGGGRLEVSRARSAGADASGAEGRPSLDERALRMRRRRRTVAATRSRPTARAARAIACAPRSMPRTAGSKGCSASWIAAGVRRSTCGCRCAAIRWSSPRRGARAGRGGRRHHARHRAHAAASAGGAARGGATAAAVAALGPARRDRAPAARRGSAGCSRRAAKVAAAILVRRLGGRARRRRELTVAARRAGCRHPPPAPTRSGAPPYIKGGGG